MASTTRPAPRAGGASPLAAPVARAGGEETGRDPVPAPARAASGAVAGWAAVGAGLAGVVFVLAHRGLIDDTYITLSFARNLVRDLHWGLVATEQSNAATSPLNVVLIAAATWVVSLVTGELRPVVGLGLLTVVLGAVLGGSAARVAHALRVPAAWSVAVVAAVLANPFVSSSLGLEVLLAAALAVWLLAEAVAGRRVALGVVAGLLVLTRLDLGVLVAAVYLLAPGVLRPWRRAWVAPVVALAVALPWYAASWWWLGSAIPDTFVIKTTEGSFGGVTFATGLELLWWDRSPVGVGTALVPAAVGVLTAVVLLVLAVLRRMPPATWPVVGLVAGGLAYYGAYVLLGVPPYQWYYAPSTVACGVGGVYGLALLVTRLTRLTRLARPVAGRAPRPSAVAGGLLAPAAATAALAAAFVVALDGRPVPWQHPVLFGSWAVPQDYLRVGAEVREIVGDATVASPPEIGSLAYACDCSMVDRFADRGITLPVIEERTERAGPLGQALLEANFARLDRTQEPRPVDYTLTYTHDPVPEGAVAAWPTWSPAAGNGTIVLERAR